MKKFKIVHQRPRERNLLQLVIAVAISVSSVAAQSTASDNNDNVPLPGGTNCSAYGYDALSNVTSGTDNTALGHSALNQLTTGSRNTAAGYEALFNNNGDDNTGIGYQALRANTSGLRNTAIGSQALNANTTGDENTAFGREALQVNTTENNNTVVGYSSDVNSAHTFETVIGSNAVPFTSGAGASNLVSFGDVNVTNIDCQVNYTSTSDFRFKFNIDKSAVSGLNFINRLRPVVYNMDTKKLAHYLHAGRANSKEYLQRDFSKSGAIRRSGFIAQEVAEAARLSGFDFDGVRKPADETALFSLSYPLFVVPLMKALQEQQSMIDALYEQWLHQEESSANTQSKSAVEYNDIADEMFVLEQNNPNPFFERTEIRFVLPQHFRSAILQVSDLAGTVFFIHEITGGGKQSVQLQAGTLKPGIYMYSIISNNVLLGSRKMVLTAR